HTLERAYSLSRSVSDPSIRGVAACSLAHALSEDVDLQQGEALFQEGMRELADDPRFEIDRVRCLRVGSEVAKQRGDARVGLARVLEAQRILQASPLATDVETMRTALDIADTYRMAGKDAEALAQFEHAATLLSRLGLDQTETAVVLFGGWGLELDQTGRELE